MQPQKSIYFNSGNQSCYAYIFMLMPYYTRAHSFATCFVCDNYFEGSIKAAKRNNRGSLDRLILCSLKIGIPSDFQKLQNNNNKKEKLLEIIEETLLSLNNAIYLFMISELQTA